MVRNTRQAFTHWRERSRDLPEPTHSSWPCETISLHYAKQALFYFFTATSSSPESSFTFAVPQVVGFPLASKRHPNSPAFFSPHCPAFTDTTNPPDPDGFPALFPCV